MIGVVAHGMVLFNKISFHDDFMIFSSSGATSGRWAGDVLDVLLKYLFWNYLSTPVFFGAFAILFFSFSSYLICMLFEIRSKISMLIISGLVVSFPAITSCFGYMFMVHTYGLAILISVLMSYIICKTKNYYISILASIVSCFAVGIYQAVLPIILSIFACYMLYDTYRVENYKLKCFLEDIVFYSINSAVTFVSYMVAEKIILLIKNEQLSSYQNVNSMGTDGVVAYLTRILVAYKMFFYPRRGAADVYPMMVWYAYFGILIIIILVSAIIIRKINWNNRNRILYPVLITCFLPIAFNFIYIMVDVEKTFVYSIMLYSLVFPFLLCTVLIEKQKDLLEHRGGDHTLYRSLRATGVTILVFIVLSNIRYSNMCYTKAIFMQEQAKSYFISLINNIQDTEGYSYDMPVMYVNDNNKRFKASEMPENFDKISIPPYSGDSIINGYSWKTFMATWCGFRPEETEIMKLYQDDEIEKMPHYPDDGAIKVINNVVVVKF